MNWRKRCDNYDWLESGNRRHWLRGLALRWPLSGDLRARGKYLSKACFGSRLPSGGWTTSRHCCTSRKLEVSVNLKLLKRDPSPSGEPSEKT